MLRCSAVWPLNLLPCMLLAVQQALPLPPRSSGFDPSNPEEVELWRLQQGLAREREYHQLAKRKAGEVMHGLSNPQSPIS